MKYKVEAIFQLVVEKEIEADSAEEAGSKAFKFKLDPNLWDTREIIIPDKFFVFSKKDE